MTTQIAPIVPTVPSDRRSRLVVIAASAGGLKALRIVLSSFEPDLNASFAIVQHRSGSQPHLLGQLLGAVTPLTVRNARAGDEIEVGRILIAPPDKHLLVGADGLFELSDGPKVSFARPSADVLFESAAVVLGSQVIAVVLTGGDGDGSAGIGHVKKHGGLVIAQDRETSQVFGMPRSAAQTGQVDFVLPVDDIGPELVRLITEGAQSTIAV